MSDVVNQGGDDQLVIGICLDRAMCRLQRMLQLRYAFSEVGFGPTLREKFFDLFRDLHFVISLR
jgi:hypothetical protein